MCDEIPARIRVSVARELLALAEQTRRCLDLPAVSAILVPPRRDDPPMQGEFGVVMLADGSTGFFYALLEDTLRRLHEELDLELPSGHTGRCIELKVYPE